ncbi:MAG: queuosine precursor transporter [Alphaproteobacteria bacterium]
MNKAILITDPLLASKQHFKYLDIIGMVWICCLMLSTFTASKIFNVGIFEFSVGVLIYPMTYIFANVFTEVYGYRQTRRIVWTGLVMLFVASLILYAMVNVPPSDHYTDQKAYETIFGQSALLTFAVMVCFFLGEITNSYILAKLKIKTNGKWLWLRAVLSTALGQLVDNFFFYGIAFGLTGTLSATTLVNLWLSTVVFCTAYEFLATPATYAICGYLKRVEGLDVYDRGTNFNPFALFAKKEQI